VNIDVLIVRKPTLWNKLRILWITKPKESSCNRSRKIFNKLKMGKGAKSSKVNMCEMKQQKKYQSGVT
jgi:hypothetical protein